MKRKFFILLDPAGADGNGPAATPAAASAASATPPEGFVSKEVMGAAIEKARKEEKDKLYPEIERLKTEVQTKDASIQTLNSQIEAFNVAKSADGKSVDIAKLIAEVSARTEQAATKLYTEELARVNGEVQGTRKQLNKMTLEQFTAKKIAEAGGEGNLVTALIRGDTEAEVSASIEQAKQAYEDIVKRVAPAGAAPTPNDRNGNGTVIAPPALPRSTPPTNGGAPQTVREMPLKDYAAQRSELRQKMANAYSGSAA
jgi:hypothetical protein